VASLELRAELVTEVKVEPATLTLYTDGTLRHEVVVTDLRPKPLRVTSARCSTPHLATRVAARSDAEPAVSRVAVEVKEDLPEGRYTELLSLATDDPVYRELRVPVTVVKRSRRAVSA